MLFNNVIFQQKKLEKYPSPVTADSAMVQHFQKISTVRVDHWLEWEITAFISLLQNGEPLHCLQWQVYDVFLIFIAVK